MIDANAALMNRIREQWGAAIAAACAQSSVPQAFLAALIANETGGDATACRFESSQAGLLVSLFLGVRASLSVTGIENHIGPADVYPDYKTDHDFAVGMQMIGSMASSFGLTQVMGWHYAVLGYDPHPADPAIQLAATLKLMAAAAPHFEMDLAMPTADEAKEWFTWWNAGSPTGKTFDPNYAANGLARMLLYEAAPPDDAPATNSSEVIN